MAKQAGRLQKLLRLLRPSKAAAEGFEVLRPEVLRVLRLAQNVPRSSFEAQYKQLVGPREVPWQSKRDAFKAFKSCCRGFECFEAFKGCPKRAT